MLALLLVAACVLPRPCSTKPGSACKPLLHVLAALLLLRGAHGAAACSCAGRMVCWLCCMLLQESVTQAGQLIKIIRVEELRLCGLAAAGGAEQAICNLKACAEVHAWGCMWALPSLRCAHQEVLHAILQLLLLLLMLWCAMAGTKASVLPLGAARGCAALL